MPELVAKTARRILGIEHPDFNTFEADAAEATGSPDPGPLEALFFANRGRLAHKWLHFLPAYDRVLAPYRGKPVKLLEIGVSQGGSLEMWRDYFGPEATIFGVDIDPDCAGRVDPPNQVRIGSQADPAFLNAVVDEMGEPDIIIDDGSHVASHQRVSFQTLFPRLKAGGLYIIEDLHTAYWFRLEGGHGRPGTAIELLKKLIDDLHAWHHSHKESFAPREELGSIQIFDSLAVIEKISRPRPVHVKTGG